MNSGTGIKTSHILLLEDDRAHQDLALRAFRDDPEPFRVTVSANILDARQVIDRDPPDLIIADWILPDGKGLDILPRRDGRVTIPLVIMTSFGDEHLAVEIMKSGAIDYVVKSATVFRDLPHIARRALREWEHIQERIRAEEAEQESRKRLADILGFLPDAMFAIDNDGRVIAWNDAIERMTGVAAEDMIGKGDHEYSIPFYGDRRPILIDLVLMEDDEVEKKYDSIQRDGTKITFETFIPTLYRGKGAYLWGTALPLFDNAGNHIGAIEVIRDITERKMAEEALQMSEEKFRTMVEASPDIIWEIDKGGTFTYISSQSATTLGYSQEELIGKLFFSLIRPEAIPAVKPKFLAHIEDKNAFRTLDVPAICRDGSPCILEIRSVPILADGQLTGFRGIARDITDQKRAELALQESERKYRFLIDNVRDIVWQTTPDLTFTYLSPAVETLTGYSPADLIGTSLFAILTDSSARVVREKLRKRMEEYSHGSRDLVTVIETEITQKIGSTRWLEVSANAVFGPGGSFEGFQGISRDITERKRTETALIESEERFRDLFSNMGAGVAIYEVVDKGEDFIFKDINRAVEKIEKVKKEDIVGRRVLEVFPGVKDLGLFSVLQRVARTGIAESHPVSIYRDNRISGWRENYVYKLPSGEIVAIYEDVTEKKQADEKLQESEEKFRTLFEHMQEGFAYCQMIYDDEGRPADWIYLEVNKAFEDLTDLGTVTGKRVLEAIPDIRELNPELFDIYGRVTLTGTPETFEIDFKPLKKWLKVSAFCPKPGFFVAAFEDVTVRKQADEKLRNSEKKYHRLYDSMRDAFASVDMGGRITLFNEPFQKMVGYGKEEIDNLTYNDLTPDKWHTIEADIVKNQVLTRGYSEIYEKEYRRKDGTVIPVEIRTFLIKDDAGNPQSMSAIVRDITERKLAEEKLRESEERYRALLFGAGIGVGYWSTDGTLLFLNEISLKRLNGTEEDFIGKTMLELFREDADMYLDRVRNAAVSPDPMEYEDYVSLPVGTGWYLSVYTRISRPDGSVMGIQVLSMDITGRKQAEEIRKAYEARLDSAMEIGSLAWWEMDLPDGAVRFDARLAAMLGYPPEKFRHYTDFTSLLHPDDYEPSMKAMKGHLEGREPRYHADYRILSDTGTYRWFRDVGGVTKRHADGSPATITGIVIDISASKEAEEALRSTEIRFRALIQNSSDIIRILDRDGLIVYESPSSERILGYPPDHLIGKNPMDYIHPDDFEQVRNDFQDVLDKTNPGTPTEFRIRKADGEYLWVDAIATNLLEVPGVNGTVVTTRPIQQRKEAEQALRENEARLATAMDIAGLVNWEFDVATGMFTFDDRFYTLYETTADREGGNLMSAETYMQEFVYPNDRPAVLTSLQKILATTNPDYFGQMEHRITPRDGSVRTIIARFAPIMGPDGKVIRTYGANQDITNFKLMESEIRSLNTALEQRVKDRTETLEKTNEALEEEIAQRHEAEKKLQAAFDEKVTLLKEVHHRVKNNLQIIVSLLNLQSRYIKDESSLAVIRESQNRIKAMALVHEKLYRTEDISHIGLNDYIRFLGTGLFQFYDARSRGIQFILDIRDVNVDIDAAIPLGLIMNELISNSLKYAFPKGRKGEIAISVKKEGHTMTVVYRDTGIGIPADLDWRDTPSLGLRLVNTLVDQLNGTVELDRSAGTAFTMVLHEKEQRGTQ